MTFRTLAVALAFAATASLSGAAVAQDMPTEPVPGMEAPAPAMGMDFSDDQLNAFATAYLEIAAIVSVYQQQMQAAQSDAELTTLQETAQAEMVTAVDAVEGIGVEEYDQIALAIQNDPALSTEVQSIIAEQAAAQ